ncbi:MAG: GNAT family N-acetyltransferase [Acidobacteriota bacterium]|nr:MAG: GNAT family N-acetyltransferase [Acidobacteriota bacterium]
MTSAANKSAITFRDIDSVDELKAVVEMQRTAWGVEDLEIVPVTQLAAVRHVGGTLVGAFDDRRLVGFAYGFYGHLNRRLVHHSHMLAVDPNYRNRDLGFKLKVEQLKRVRDDRLADRITWTFDPLQSLNAHFNFNKLGVLADTYKVNFYGSDATSFLHRTGTDRLLVTWLIESPRVIGMLNRRSPEGAGRTSAPKEPAAGTASTKGDSSEGNFIAIEIPTNIGDIEREDLDLARLWREKTRRSFTEALEKGFIVTDYVLGSGRTGMYILRRKTIGQFE